MEKLVLLSVICLATMHPAKASNGCSIEESSASSSSNSNPSHSIRLNQNAITRACEALIPPHFDIVEKGNVVALLATEEQTAASLIASLRTAIATYETAIAHNEIIATRWQQFKKTFCDYKYGTNFELALLQKTLDGCPYSLIRKELKTLYAEKPTC